MTLIPADVRLLALAATGLIAGLFLLVLGIPRYLALYQSRMLGSDIGPIRSARVYFVLWASEWNALYGHSGGSPQALRMLRDKGQGEYVFDANEFRYGGGAFGRGHDRHHQQVHPGSAARRRRTAAIGAGPQPDCAGGEGRHER